MSIVFFIPPEADSRGGEFGVPVAVVDSDMCDGQQLLTHALLQQFEASLAKDMLQNQRHAANMPFNAQQQQSAFFSRPPLHPHQTRR